ncbi:hypothetical protein [Thaumasiovibrio subtropicus]|nr:hypothetical protein [Thaumasiovibrio subtropicus]
MKICLLLTLSLVLANAAYAASRDICGEFQRAGEEQQSLINVIECRRR